MSNHEPTMVVRQASVSAAAAQQLLAALQAECTERGISLGFAVVDAGRNVVSALRMDGAQLGALDIALDKAHTAVSFGFPTSAWVESSTPGQGDWGFTNTLGGRTIVFPGGVPLYADGALIGGLGVSGAAATVDEACALAAAAACGIATSQ